MTDSVDEIRHWHKMSLDKTSQHWQHVDTLLAGGPITDDDELSDILDELRDIASQVSDIAHQVREMRKRQKP